MSSALVYLKYDQERSKARYAIALGLFVLGLMSKGAIVTLPAALLLIFWWKRGKLFWKPDVLPLIPFFIVGISSGLVIEWVERNVIGAKGSLFQLSIIERFLIAGRDIWFYLGKVFWPVDLTINYPRWDVSPTLWWQYLFPTAVVALVAVLWRFRTFGRGPITAALFFIGTLFPALSFANVNFFRYSFVADRFQYLACLGPIVLAAAVMNRIISRFGRRGAVLGPVCGAILLATLGTLTWRQCHAYRDEETLWRATIAKNPASWLAHNNLGEALLQDGKVDEAIFYFKNALQIKPDYPEAHDNLGNALLDKGMVDEAIAQYQTALQIAPSSVEACCNLGNAWLQKGNLEQATVEYQKALQIMPNSLNALNNLAWVLATCPQASLRDANKAVELAQQANRLTGGVDPDILGTLATAYLEAGQAKQAIVEYQKVLQITPDSVDALNNLAWVLATCSQASLRDGNKAVELAQRADRLTGGTAPDILQTLATAYAAARRFPEAINIAQRAIQLAEKQSNTALADSIRSELHLFRQGRPYHSQ
ncbi:MAG TPA: tetratricopeptide repeat protein [Verrucomicrobiae bacterium]|nr:tetratricopeptide repeat protein [Verrucomicrobiae bacterium]